MAYLVTLDDAAQLSFGRGRTAKIAEITLSSTNPTRLEIDPQLTMLVDDTGTRTATVGGSSLVLEGADIGGDTAPPPGTPDRE